MSYSNKAKAVITTAVLSTAAMSVLTGCGPGDKQDVYCVDHNNNVVDESRCDDNGNVSGGGGYFIFMGNLGGNTYRPGQRIPSSYISSGQKINPTDAKARSNAGLPKAGKVGNGTRITGGIGSGGGGGSKGGSAKGGSAGG